MPYIKSNDYARAASEPSVPGELNYAITLKIINVLEQRDPNIGIFYAKVLELCRDYLARVGLSYTNGNAVIGVLDCATREMHRRVNIDPLSTEGWKLDGVTKQLDSVRTMFYNHALAPYENMKIAENGDVYPTNLTGG